MLRGAAGAGILAHGLLGKDRRELRAADRSNVTGRGQSETVAEAEGRGEGERCKHFSFQLSVGMTLAVVLKFISMFGEIDRHILNHFICIIFINDVTNSQTRQPIGRCASPHIVPRRDGAEGTRVVVEACRVIQSRRFHDLIEVTRHSVQTVVEPPWRTEFQRGIVSGQRSEFARVGGFIEREQDQGKMRIVSIFVQQADAGCACIRSGSGMSAPLSKPKSLEDDLVVIAQ